MNSFAALSQGADSDEPSEQDIEFLQLKALNPDVKVNLSDSPFDTEKYPSHVSLLVCSSKFGYFVAGTPKGFVYGDLSKLRSTFNNADKGATASLTDKIDVPVSQGPVHHLRLTAGQEKIIVGLADGQILLFDAKSIATKANLQPTKTFSAGSAILDIRPNPEDKPDTIAVLLTNHTCHYMSLSSGSIIGKLPDSDATAICWSPKGKQITVGNRKGYLSQYDHDGNLKTAVEPPEAMTVKGGEEQDRYVQSVLWVENNIFLPIYAAPTSPGEDQPAHIYDGYIITRQPGTTNKTYTRLTDICMPFGQQDRQGQYYLEVVKGLGAEAPYVILVASAPSSAIGIVGQDKSGDWAVWNLDDTARGNLPLSEKTDMDTSPFGLAVDFSSTERLEALDPSEPEKTVDPVPILYYLNDEANMGAFHCLNVEAAKRSEAYGGIVKSSPLAPSAASAPSIASAPATQSSPFSSTFGGPGGFGAGKSTTAQQAVPSASQPSPFTSTFGGPGGFGAGKSAATSSSPSFGAPGGFGSSKAAAPTNTPKTSGFPGFGNASQEAKSSPAPAFNFGKPAASPGTPPAATSFNFGSPSNQSASLPKPSTPTGGFSFQSKPAASVPAPAAAAAPKAPATSVASSQAKPAFDGFKTASPLQTPSSFASSPSKSDTSDAGTFKVDKPSLSFGAASPSTAPSPSVTSSAATPKPTAAATPASSAEAQQKEVLMVEILGMAKEFESTYITLSSELANLGKFAEASEKLNASNRQSTGSLNTLDALKNVDQWKLSDMKTQINLTRQLLEKVKGLHADSASIKSHLSKLDKEAVKNAHKQQEIQNLIDAKSNSKSEVKATHLGPEAQETLRKLEEATMKINDAFKNTENQVERVKKNIVHTKKSTRGLSQPSLYTIHRTLRDIRNGLFVHNVELDEVEARLGSLNIEEKVRPRSHSSRFSFDELMGEDVTSSKSKQTQARPVQLPPASPQAMESASQMLFEENFLYRLSDAATTRQPAVRRFSSQPVVERGRSHEPLDPSPLGIDLASLDISDINTPRKLKAPVKEPNVIEFTDTEDEEDQEEEEEKDEEESWSDEYYEKDDESQEADEEEAEEAEEWEDDEENEQPQAEFTPPTFGKKSSEPESVPKWSFGAVEANKPAQPAAPVKMPSFGQEYTKEQQTPKKEEPAKFTGFSFNQQPKQPEASKPEEPAKFSGFNFGQKLPETPTKLSGFSFGQQSESQPKSTLEQQPTKLSSFGFGLQKEQPLSESKSKAEDSESESQSNAEVESEPEQHVEPQVSEAESEQEVESEQGAKLEQPEPKSASEEEDATETAPESESKAEPTVEPESTAEVEEDAPQEEQPEVEKQPQDTSEEAEPTDGIEQEQPVTEVEENAGSVKQQGADDDEYVVVEADRETEDMDNQDIQGEEIPAGVDEVSEAASALTFGSGGSFNETSQATGFGKSTSPFGGAAPSTGFGSTAPATTTSPFGGSSSFGNTASTAPSFGGTSGFGATSPSSGFGSSTTAPAPVFGSPAPTKGFSSSTPAPFGSSTSTSPFGSTSSTSAPFGSQPPASSSSFGSFSAPFGGSSQTTSAPFGSSSGTSGFGTPAPSQFGGQQQQAPAFGSTTSFGAQASTTQPSFGSTTSFGASAAPSFGSTTSFGANATPSFGSTTGFGAKAAPAFGATSQLSTPGFGSTSSLGGNYSRGFGSAPSSTFGSNTSFGSSGGGFASAAQSGTGFGAAAQQGQNIFANQQPNANTFTPAQPFGQQQQQPKPFGNVNPAFTQFRNTSMEDD
ncbi:hypothetical protein NQZ79_g5460 [Umbelopsis isabellina]|nr:hypothetical protein NQZ79_g5460 [Umbelopsis isabellina]